jgi:DNA polymerase III delta prime subunit
MSTDPLVFTGNDLFLMIQQLKAEAKRLVSNAMLDLKYYAHLKPHFRKLEEEYVNTDFSDEFEKKFLYARIYQFKARLVEMTNDTINREA